MAPATARLAGVTFAALLGIVLWDLSGLDLELARAMGGPQGFPLRDNWVLARALHTGPRAAAWLFAMALCLAVAWPIGFLRHVSTSRRVQLVVSAALAWSLVAFLKFSSRTSCPWDLDDFGGVAHYVIHWMGWAVSDGGAGRCFPAGHVTVGFAFIGGFFALQTDAPRQAATWLASALAVGFALGIVQQFRGAHFMSHTLWSAWLCWTVGWVSDRLFANERQGTATRAPW